MRLQLFVLLSIVTILLSCEKNKEDIKPIRPNLPFPENIRHFVVNDIDTIIVQNGENGFNLIGNDLTDIEYSVKQDTLFIAPADDKPVKAIHIYSQKLKSLDISDSRICAFNLNQPTDSIRFDLKGIDSVKSNTVCKYNYGVMENVKGTFTGSSETYNITTSQNCTVNSKDYRSQFTYVFAWDSSRIFIGAGYYLSVIACHESRVYFWETPQQELLSTCGNGQIIRM